ncbi:hypothetical protein SAMN05428985_11046 [Nocardioides sp. YR527]|uniref:hypothetical protein n=1 Tax=Nocardioides sp. YR527 TaxID=1881028 RepID=UPI00088F22D3|nr:hypothetical protein [Nocardioides sp. YR527]SDL14627.1 hypothetical protein SAMN05428985_11046 [Nocardioides sp. YR527]
MNGPDHYRKAEDIMAKVETGTLGPDHFNRLVGQAQVHATLALVMATVNAGEGIADQDTMSLRDRGKWIEAAGATPTPIPDDEPPAPQIF